VTAENQASLFTEFKTDNRLYLFYHLFYATLWLLLDPPYYKATYYKHNFKLHDHSELSDSLSKIKFHFILSINDFSSLQEVFKGFVAVDRISMLVPRNELSCLIMSKEMIKIIIGGSVRGEFDLLLN